MQTINYNYLAQKIFKGGEKENIQKYVFKVIDPTNIAIAALEMIHRDILNTSDT